jgi:hypothetical protein
MSHIINYKRKLFLTIAIIPTLFATNIHISYAAPQSFEDLISKIIGIINIIIPGLITLAIVLFFYHTGRGIFGDAQSGGDAKTKLKDTLLWGVIIIFVMVSIWGILNLIGGELDILQPSFMS